MYEKRKWDHRRSIRLQSYDYSRPGYYFVTICVQRHKCVFGRIVDDCMCLNSEAKIIQMLWERLPLRFPTVRLDAFVIMPNHLHGIIQLTEPLPLSEKPVISPRIPVRFQDSMKQAAARSLRPVLGEVVRDFKGAASYEIHKYGEADFGWQRNYYESVIQDEELLDEIRNYIVNNPTTWARDKLYMM